MPRVVEVILAVSLALVGYCYFVYPLVIWACSRLFGRRPVFPQLADDDLPDVTLLIAAHNEERWIGARIENALALDYPCEKLEVVVASDGSRDATVAIATGFTNARVRVLD